MMGPSQADLDRTRRWNAWRDDVFTEASKTLGVTDSHGAQRWFGDFVISCEATEEVGTALLWVATDPNKPLTLVGYGVTVLWEKAESQKAATAVVEMCERIRLNPMYVITKRASVVKENGCVESVIAMTALACDNNLTRAITKTMAAYSQPCEGSAMTHATT